MAEADSLQGSKGGAGGNEAGDFDPLKCFIGGVPHSVDEGTFRAYFSQFGEVLESWLMYDPEKRPRGFGFVSFAREEALAACLSRGSKHELHSKFIDVKRATRATPRGGMKSAPRLEKQRSTSAEPTSAESHRRHASNNETVLGGDLKVGKCKKFDNAYGFITFIIDGKERDIFVHCSDIYARDGEKSPSLAVGEAVEFYIVKDPFKNEDKAVKVTGPKRAHVQGQSTVERSFSFGTITQRSWDILRR